MEQRNAATQFVVGGKLHVFACQQPVVGNVIVRQHDSFWETGRSGGVLHVHYVMRLYFLFCFNQRIVTDVLA